jgi:hypothetical protein
VANHHLHPHGGWNAIYLHGDATHATIDTLLAANPESSPIWRWNPNPNADPVQHLDRSSPRRHARVEHVGPRRHRQHPRDPHRPATPTSSNAAGTLGTPTPCPSCTRSSRPAAPGCATAPTSSVSPRATPRGTYPNIRTTSPRSPSRSPPTPKSTNTTAARLGLEPDPSVQYRHGARRPHQGLLVRSRRRRQFLRAARGQPVEPRRPRSTAATARSSPSACATAPPPRHAHRRARGLSAPRPSARTQITAAVPLTYRTFNTTTGQYDRFTPSRPPRRSRRPAVLRRTHLRRRPRPDDRRAGASTPRFLRFTDGGNLMDVYLPVSAQRHLPRRPLDRRCRRHQRPEQGPRRHRHDHRSRSRCACSFTSTIPAPPASSRKSSSANSPSAPNAVGLCTLESAP